MKVFESFISVILTVFLGLAKKKETSVTSKDTRGGKHKNYNWFINIYRFYLDFSQNKVVKAVEMSPIYPYITFENQSVSVNLNLLIIKERKIAFIKNNKADAFGHHY